MFASFWYTAIHDHIYFDSWCFDQLRCKFCLCYAIAKENAERQGFEKPGCGPCVCKSVSCGKATWKRKFWNSFSRGRHAIQGRLVRYNNVSSAAFILSLVLSLRIYEFCGVNK